MILRKYQSEAIEKLRSGLRSGFVRQMLMLATAAGKTAISASMTKSAVDKGFRVWFIVDNLELVEQTLSTFKKFGLDVGVVQGNHEETDYRKCVQVLTAQTLSRRWSRFDENPQWLPDLCFVDEAHVQYKAHQQLINMMPRLPIVGLSATPFSKGLGLKYDNIINVIGVSDLIKKGYLNDFECYGVDNPDMKGVKIQSGDYSTKHAHKRVSKIVGNVVKTWIEKASERKTIVFACNIAHSEQLALEFNSVGVDAVHLDGFTDKEERRKIIEKFRNGEIPVLCSVMVLVKGFDAPICDCAILAAPTKSLSKHIQCLGRALRVHDGKRKTLFLDHAGNFQRLGFPDDKLPEYLCKSNKDKEEKRREIDEKKDLPTACEKCSFLSIEFICPKCGHKPEKRTSVVEVSGKLKKLARVAPEVKQMWFGMLLGYANSKGYSEGWASHKYKEKFKVWPAAKKGIAPLPPNEEVMRYVKYLNIRNAKSKKFGY